MSKGEHCEWLLTLLGRGSGGVLEGGEGPVVSETLCNVLGALGTNAVALEAASKSQITTLGAANAPRCLRMSSSVLERFGCRV